MGNELSQHESDTTKTQQKKWFRIVIVAYRSAEYLQACLDSVYEQSFSDFEVIVVNNDCPERSTDQLVLPDDRFKIIEAGANIGFAGGANLGAADADSEWLITLNPDASAHPDWLLRLYETSRTNPEYDMLGTTLLSSEENNIVDGFGDVVSMFGACWRGGHGADVSSLPDSNQEVFGACAAAAAYRTKLFARLGGFDESYFCYLEDIDLAFRFQNWNKRCLQVRHSIVYHKGGGSSADGGSFATYQTYRNNIRLIVKNARPLMLAPMLLGHILTQCYSIFKNRQSTLTRCRWRGMRDGISALFSSVAGRRSAQSGANATTLDICRRLYWRPSGMKRQVVVSFSKEIS